MKNPFSKAANPSAVLPTTTAATGESNNRLKSSRNHHLHHHHRSSSASSTVPTFTMTSRHQQLRDQRYCRCIPFRFGLWILAIALFVPSLGVLLILWVANMHRYVKVNTPASTKIIYTVLYSIYILLAVMFAFVVPRMRRFQSRFRILIGTYWLLLVMALFEGAYFGYLASQKTKLFANCDSTKIKPAVLGISPDQVATYCYKNFVNLLYVVGPLVWLAIHLGWVFLTVMYTKGLRQSMQALANNSSSNLNNSTRNSLLPMHFGQDDPAAKYAEHITIPPMVFTTHSNTQDKRPSENHTIAMDIIESYRQEQTIKDQQRISQVSDIDPNMHFPLSPTLSNSSSQQSVISPRWSDSTNNTSTKSNSKSNTLNLPWPLSRSHKSRVSSNSLGQTGNIFKSIVVGRDQIYNQPPVPSSVTVGASSLSVATGHRLSSTPPRNAPPIPSRKSKTHSQNSSTRNSKDKMFGSDAYLHHLDSTDDEYTKVETIGGGKQTLDSDEEEDSDLEGRDESVTAGKQPIPADGKGWWIRQLQAKKRGEICPCMIVDDEEEYSDEDGHSNGEEESHGRGRSGRPSAAERRASQQSEKADKCWCGRLYQQRSNISPQLMANKGRI